MRCLALLLALTTAACGAFAGGTLSGGSPIQPGVPYVARCSSCHDFDDGPRDLFSEAWRRENLTAEAMLRTVRRVLADDTHAETAALLTLSDRHAIERALICHHFPRARVCERFSQGR